MEVASEVTGLPVRRGRNIRGCGVFFFGGWDGGETSVHLLLRCFSLTRARSAVMMPSVTQEQQLLMEGILIKV